MQWSFEDSGRANIERSNISEHRVVVQDKPGNDVRVDDKRDESCVEAQGNTCDAVTLENITDSDVVVQDNQDNQVETEAVDENLGTGS